MCGLRNGKNNNNNLIIINIIWVKDGGSSLDDITYGEGGREDKGPKVDEADCVASSHSPGSISAERR